MRRSPSLLQERHFLAEADLCVHILSMLNTPGTETRTTPLILAVSEMSAMPEPVCLLRSRSEERATWKD